MIFKTALLFVPYTKIGRMNNLPYKRSFSSSILSPLSSTSSSTSTTSSTANFSTNTSPSNFTLASMEEIVNLCKRKGFVYQPEFYHSHGGFFDYGPLGTELKNNIKNEWWKEMIHKREDIVGIDSSIIGSSKMWEASGHVDGFSDPMVDCKVSKLRYRADQLFYAPIYSISSPDSSPLFYMTVVESEDTIGDMMKQAKKKAKTLNITEKLAPITEVYDLSKAPADIYHLLPSPATGNPGDLTPPREFNLMFKTSIGALAEESSENSIGYLRPETAQGIFTNFLHVQRTSRLKIPFGIGQIGKSFRNEITPRNFIFRSREFEQMEIEYFIHPEDDVWPKHYNNWIDISWNWLKKIGVKEELMEKLEHPSNKLAHYAKACTDITFRFPFGQQELMGIAARGDYDLKQHSIHTKKEMTYLDSATNNKFLPHVIEPSLGIDRLFLSLIVSSYNVEIDENNEKRIYLSFPPSIAPVKVCILPLLSNKQELTDKAKMIYNKLKLKYNVEYDSAGKIGKRYYRADEAGTPFCITVDFETLENDTVTIRYRDSKEQIRLSLKEIFPFLKKEIDGYNEDDETF